jgi:hypothetical protein
MGRPKTLKREEKLAVDTTGFQVKLADLFRSTFFPIRSCTHFSIEPLFLLVHFSQAR